MRLKLAALLAATACLIPAALADCPADHHQQLVSKLQSLQAAGENVDTGVVYEDLKADFANCPDDYQGIAMSIHLMTSAVAREADPVAKMEQINFAFKMLRQASDTYDSKMQPFTYTDESGAEQSFWAWGHARNALGLTFLPHLVLLAESGLVEPSLTGGAPAVCPYGETPRLSDEVEGRFWVTLLESSSKFGTAGLGDEDDLKFYDQNLAVYDRRVEFAKNRLSSLAKACPASETQFLYDRARVMGQWAQYSDRQANQIKLAIEDFRVDRDRRDIVTQLREDLLDQRNARARDAAEAYNAFYASKAKTDSHLEFRLADEQTYIDVTGWSKTP